MQHISAVVIGAGQAGLAMSQCLSARGIKHVVLERGRVGERWRSERWDSLRLLTPNWMTRLPGWSYQGNEPDGFMTAGAFAGYLQAYADGCNAPVVQDTLVNAVRRTPLGYRIETNRGIWKAQAVIIATGHCDVPAVPAMGRMLSPSICQVTPSDYRNPAQLPDGGVLVVGAAATGVQLAEEIHRSGRPVSLSAGRHTRLPRSYRGRDIWWWLERTGLLDETIHDVSDLRRSRNQPSFQLVGRRDGRTLDLGVLRTAGVRMLGRAFTAEGSVIRLRDDLAETSAAAHDALKRLLSRIDPIADAAGAPVDRASVHTIDLGPSPTVLDLEANGIRSVVWATGFSRNYSWLQVPVLDAKGEIMQQGGITPSPGLYVLGLRFMRRRKSNFIDGVGTDAAELADDVQSYLAPCARVAA
jgi:putative flavoprotein involved in K+ transport